MAALAYFFWLEPKETKVQGCVSFLALRALNFYGNKFYALWPILKP
jgi:hypothetical protein